MNWFQGEISLAISSAKSSRSVFIVYISGTDDQSKDHNALWEREDVVTVCNSNNYVALRLDVNSDACKQFSAIYPVVVVPCTFLIGENGIPLDVIAAESSSNAFITKLKDAFEKHKISLQTSSVVSAETPGTSGEGEGNAQQQAASMSLDDKVQRAKDLIAQQQAKKEADEKEKVKQKEIERREIARSAAKHAQRKEEAELSEVRKQIQKVKEADRLAREKVRQQIARDRAEKTEAFQRQKAAKEKDQQQKEEARQSKIDAEALESKQQDDKRRSESARIQFRLADSSTVNHIFAHTDTLQDIDAFISQHLGNRVGTLTLSTIYPRRTFTADDMAETAESLGLTPSAVIMAVPKPSMLSPPSLNPLFSLISLIMAPITMLWNVVYGFLFGSPPARPQGRHTPSSTPSSNRPNTAFRRRTPQSDTTSDGNIHRLSQRRNNNSNNNDDDDDDNATWNGNSTQQM